MITRGITTETTIKEFRFRAAAVNFIDTHYPADDLIKIIYRNGFYEVVLFETTTYTSN